MSFQVTKSEGRNRIRILLVDDDASFADMAATLLEQENEQFEVARATGPDEALEVFESAPIDAIVSDLRMPKRDGLELLHEVRSVDSQIPFILLTGDGSENIASEAISAGVTDYFRKGNESDQYAILANRISNAVSKHRSEQSLRDNERFLQDVFDGVRNGMAVVNEDMVIVRANEWLAERFEGPITGRKCYEVIWGSVSPPDRCPVQRALETGERQREEADISNLEGSDWAQISTDPLPKAGDAEPHVLIQIEDISERKRRELKLQKRERLVRKMHDQTKGCLAASSREEVLTHVVDSMTESLGYSRIAVLAYDRESGDLEAEDTSHAFESNLGDLRTVEPGDGPLWETFRDEEARVISAPDLRSWVEAVPDAETDFVAVPVSDHGVIVIHRNESVDFEDIDIEMVNLCSANVEATLDRIQKEGQLGSASESISAQATQIENLREFLQAIRAIHREVALAETRPEMEQTVVTELISMDAIDFAWIARPETGDTHLSPTTWAGNESGYLDSVDLDSDAELLPSQQAARERQPVTVPSISENLSDATWSKETLSMGFRSVSAFPIEYDGVLYGVLSVYSTETGIFDTTSTSLVANVTSLLASHIAVRNLRLGADESAVVELEFSLRDANHPLHTVAVETGQLIRFQTMLESGEESVRIVVTVPNATDEEFVDRATDITQVHDAEWFGDPADRTVLLELGRPFLGTGIARHGGTLKSAVSDGTESTVTIGVPSTSQVRPLAEWLQKTYQEVDLVAKRDPEDVFRKRLSDPADYLTDRQLETLKAAYFGGYFETPRKITGEELAESFDVSGSTVYNHLRAAEKRLFGQLFDFNAENRGLDD